MIKYPAISANADIMGTQTGAPAVSIILSSHPVFSSGSDLRHRLKVALENVRHQLNIDFTSEASTDVADRLNKLQTMLSPDGKHKGIALFASRDKGKICYLDIPIEDRIVIGEDFAVRELIQDSKERREYLLLLLSEGTFAILLVRHGHPERLKLEIPSEVYAYVNEKPRRVANFEDPGKRREIVMDKFLAYVDKELSRVLQQYALPVIVFGPERVTGHFRAHSQHVMEIAGVVDGNYMAEDSQRLLELAQPCLAALGRHDREKTLGLLSAAADQQRLSVGIEEVWAAVSKGNAHLLSVERNYRFAGRSRETSDRIEREDHPEENPFYIPDAVEVLMGRVISQGGDVVFMEDGMLREFDRIALIRHY